MSERDEKLLKEARERFEIAVDAESEQREKMLEDQRFEAGDQWPDRIKQARENDSYGPRPCLVINKAQAHVRNLVNDIRQNRPSIKVLPVDDGADVETAKMLDGLIRHIQVTSDADVAYDEAVRQAVVSGVGYLRVGTIVTDEETNEQEIEIRPIFNWGSVYMDPMHEHPTGMDSRWCFVVEDMRRDEVLEIKPDAEIMDWEEATKSDELRNWYPEENVVRVAQYWYVAEESDKRYMTEAGEFDEEAWGAFDGHDDRPKLIEEKSTPVKRVYVCKMLGNDVLEEPTPFASEYIGIIRVAGEERLIEGKRDTRGLIRDMRDPCRMYNYWASLNTEKIALAPKTPIVVAEGQVEGYESEWQKANTANIPYLTYKPTTIEGQTLPPPQRMAPIGQDTAIIQAMLQAADDIKAVSGQYDPALGNQSNETSGKAIIARQRQSDVSTFHFSDNLSRALKQVGRVLISMIPTVYDTARMVRILGEDNSPGFAQIRPDLETAYTQVRDVNGRLQKLYNPSVGLYDVVVSTGPSYATKRIEAVNGMAMVLQGNPQLWPMIGDLVVRSMDWPGADDMADRLKAMLPPQLKQLEDAKADGNDPMAQAQAAVMAQIGPQLQQLQEQLQQAVAKIGQDQQEIAALQQKLDSKQGDVQARMHDATLRHDAETTKAALEFVAAQMQGQATEKPPNGGNGASDPRMPAGMGEHVTANMALRATEQAAEERTEYRQMAEAMAAHVDKLTQIAASAFEAQKAAQESLVGQITEIEHKIAAEDTKDAQTRAAVVAFLKGDQSDDSLKKTVRQLERLH